MSQPQTYTFPACYRNDGLAQFTIGLTYQDETPVDLDGAEIRMQLINKTGQLVWEFSSAEGSKALITILPDGVMQFPSINSWSIESGTHKYDLQVTDASGFVTTYLTGTWAILDDITKAP